ncbi:MAG TPA: hypothetical protein VLA88_00855 [Candidatus Saccharimonadales bacterium]|nr:hypothetical protein [Candidatus Saccharimonadales bacterium]
MAQQPTVSAPPQVRERAQALNELTKVVDSAQEILARAQTVFPMDLFPDTVVVDRTQVVIVQRSFFFVGGTTSVRIEDILNVTANVGPFFGSLKISTRYFDPDKPYEVRRLWRHDALRLQAIIQGLVIAAQKEIDTTVFDRRELVKGLTKVGQVSSQDGI